MRDLGIVIPAYNEEASLANVLNRTKVSCPEARILVVNDCSTDSTPNVAESCCVEVITNPINYNYGKSLRTGFAYLVEKYDVQYLAFLDADATYPPESIGQLYKLVKEHNLDIAVGSRFLSPNTGMPLIRRIGNKIFAWLISFYSKKYITDTGTGLRLFKAEMVPLFNTLPDGLQFTPAMTSFLVFQDIKYAELPINYGKRVGRSKLSNIKDGYRFLDVIMKAARKYRPGLFYCTLGIPFLVLEFIVTGAPQQNI